MRILIMVLSFTEEPYLTLMKTQQQTFDSIDVEDVATIYYHGGFDKGKILKEGYVGYKDSGNSWEQLSFRCTDDYYFMAAKFKMALEYLKHADYDLIFRSNSSSYINKQKLKEFAETLPIEKLYAGKTLVDVNDFNGLAVSGAGIWMSKDVAEILRKEIDPEFSMEEDIYIGRILRKNGITAIEDNSRYDVPITIPEDFPTDRYHYRLKSGPGNRLADIGNMREIHKLITQENGH